MAKRRLSGKTPAVEKRRRKSRWVSWAVIAGAVLVVGGLVLYFALQGPGVVAKKGSPAPDFTLQLLDGKSLSLSSVKGKAVLVNFWHST
jgi:cytochrome oxidase Cu insertion factor (SCO1/SenC/PrrC family)